MIEHQIANHKLQINSKYQAPNCLKFVIWNLVIGAYLELGA